MKKLLATVVTAGLLLAGGASGAYATGSGSGGTNGPAKRAHVRVARRAAAGALQVAAKTIGVSPQDLKNAIKGGQTVAQVAQSKNVDPAKVVDAIVAAGRQRINTAVTNRHLDAAKAEKLQARLQKAADTFVNHTNALKAKVHELRRRGVRRAAAAGALQVAAKTIGVSPQDLKNAIKGGQTVAQVAQSKNVDPAKVVDAIVAAGRQRINTAVTNRHLDAAKAQKLQARLQKAADTFVNHTNVLKGAKAQQGSIT